jgi:hypothetical protein
VVGAFIGAGTRTRSPELLAEVTLNRDQSGGVLTGGSVWCGERHPDVASFATRHLESGQPLWRRWICQHRSSFCEDRRGVSQDQDSAMSFSCGEGTRFEQAIAQNWRAETRT